MFSAQTRHSRSVVVSRGVGDVYKIQESDSGLLGYTDANGVKQQIKKTDVKEVSEIPH
ncbi:DUF903 domain-containing protein [Enterobacter hormaechei]